MPICNLCERQVGYVSRHHIVPRSEGGKLTVDLCSPCHRTLHAFFENKTLAESFNTIELIRRDPKIAAYLKWVRKQQDRRITVQKANDRR
jgi:hypothetical protein